jgi:hypothetical protein
MRLLGYLPITCARCSNADCCHYVCSVPTTRDYASNIVTKLHVVDWPQAMVTGPVAGLDDAVVPPHDGAVERSYRSWLSQLPQLGRRISHR